MSYYTLQRPYQESQWSQAKRGDGAVREADASIDDLT